jgi:hypothetical protein
MPLTPVDRAAIILAAEAVIALPLGDLAARIGVDPDLLVGRLRADPRFVVFRPDALPDLELLTEDGRGAFRAALERAGLSDEPSVAVLGGPCPHAEPVAELLRGTVLALLAADAGDPLAATARPLHRALRVSLDAFAAAPSTTPPPDPAERYPALPQPRRTGPTRTRRP